MKALPQTGPTLARFCVFESEGGGGAGGETPRSKSIRLNPFDTCSLSNTTSKPNARVAAAAAMTDLEAELGQGYSYTCVASLHPLSTNLGTNFSSLPGSVLAGPQKSEQFS